MNRQHVHSGKFWGVAAMAFALASGAEAQITTKPVTVVNKLSGKCASVWDKTSGNSLQIKQAICDGASHMSWTLAQYADGFQVQAAHSGSCLGVAWESTSNGGYLEQYQCRDRNSQVWYLESVPSSRFYRLRSKLSSKCMAIESASEDPGKLLVQQDCVSTTVASADLDRQLWSFGDGFVPAAQPARLVSGHSGRCLTVSGASAGATATQSSCQTAQGASTQGIRLERAGQAYRLIVSSTGQCVGVAGGSTAEGASIVQWPCDGSADHAWDVLRSGTGHRFINRKSLRCLDTSGSSTADGALAVQRQCDQAVASQVFQVSVEHELGAWSGVTKLPLIPVAAAMLKNGRVLFWSSYDNFVYSPVDNNCKTQTAVYDPAQGTISAFTVDQTQHDMFCPGTSLLPDGRVLVNGGVSNQKTSLYDPTQGAWTAGALMNTGRGYNGTTTLDTGAAFTIGGSWSGPSDRTKGGELWSPEPRVGAAGREGTWTSKPGLPASLLFDAIPVSQRDPSDTGPFYPLTNYTDSGAAYRSDNHAWLFGIGSGWILHAGPGPRMNLLNTANGGSYAPLNSSLEPAGPDSNKMRLNGNAVMYDTGKILKLGGAERYQGSAAHRSAYVVDVRNSVQVVPTGALTEPRTFANSVVLPDGRVVVVGGQTTGVNFSDKDAVLHTEVWSSATQSFTKGAALNVPRNYHSVALLLPSGEVLAGGGGLCDFSKPGCGANHPDIQIYTPASLFQPNGLRALRPRITSVVPQTLNHGQILSISADKEIASFVLIRMSSVTHSVNNDQRRIPLAASLTSGSTYNVTIEPSTGNAIPGYYMLFALDRANVPSVAKIVQVPPRPGA